MAHFWYTNKQSLTQFTSFVALLYSSHNTGSIASRAKVFSKGAAKHLKNFQPPQLNLDASAGPAATEPKPSLKIHPDTRSSNEYLNADSGTLADNCIGESVRVAKNSPENVSFLTRRLAPRASCSQGVLL